MARSEIVHKINALTLIINQLKEDINKLRPSLTGDLRREIAMLEDHRNDLQSIYNTHLYKLP